METFLVTRCRLDRRRERSKRRVDRGVVPSERRSIEIPELGRLLVRAQPARREDEDILDGPSFQHPAEMPLAFCPVHRSVRLAIVDIDVPRADELAVELQFC